jgi:hypothetical protein
MGLREKLKKGLREAVEDSYRTKDSISKNIFDYDKIRNINFFKPGAGPHCVGILPFLMGENHPKVVKGQKKAGEGWYNVEVFTHRNVGPNEDTFICLQKTYGQPCPICQHKNTLDKSDKFEGEERIQMLKDLEPKRRVVYAIIDRDAESKGVLLWEVAHFFMEKHIVALARKRHGGFLAFVDPDLEEGRDVQFEIKGSAMSTQYMGHQLIEREEAIPDDLLETVPVLDELLNIPTYEEVKYAFFAGMDEEGVKPETEEDYVPPEDDYEEFKETKTVEKKKEPECPAGGTFGADFMSFKECRKCPIGDDCEEKEKEFSTPKKTEDIPETTGKPPIRRRS